MYYWKENKWSANLTVMITASRIWGNQNMKFQKHISTILNTLIFFWNKIFMCHVASGLNIADDFRSAWRCCRKSSRKVFYVGYIDFKEQ